MLSDPDKGQRIETYIADRSFFVVVIDINCRAVIKLREMHAGRFGLSVVDDARVAQIGQGVVCLRVEIYRIVELVFIAQQIAAACVKTPCIARAAAELHASPLRSAGDRSEGDGRGGGGGCGG